jgi:hypothetical protein
VPYFKFPRPHRYCICYSSSKQIKYVRIQLCICSVFMWKLIHPIRSWFPKTKYVAYTLNSLFVIFYIDIHFKYVSLAQVLKQPFCYCLCKDLVSLDISFRSIFSTYGLEDKFLWTYFNRLPSTVFLSHEISFFRHVFLSIQWQILDVQALAIANSNYFSRRIWNILKPRGFFSEN